MKRLLLFMLVVGCGDSTVSNPVDAGVDTNTSDGPLGLDTNCASSTQNCGGCGLSCSALESCCKGSCTSDPACTFEVSSISPAVSWMSGGAYVTVHGTGFSKGLHAYVGDARVPVRVIDAQTVLLLTAPAPLGLYDVRLQQGNLSATLPKAINVRTEGFGKQWTTISMSTPRGNFPAMTTLQDGRVLVVGGTATSLPSSSLDTAELYDPATQKMTPAANKMSTARNTVSAITLLDGRALVVGTCNVPSGSGCNSPGDRALADLFDPKTNKFSATKTPLTDSTRVYIRMVLLPDARVLLTSNASATAEIFDPETDSFSAAPSKSGNSAFGFSVRLRDGRIALVSDKTEVIDPDSLAVTPLSAGVAHGAAAVYTLPDGRVISPGGADVINNNVTPTDEIALLDPSKPNVVLLAQKLSAPRLKFASALLGDGTVMVAGGVTAPYPITYGCQSDTFPTTKIVEVVDPAKGTVAPFPSINDTNMELVATTLLDGSILIGGGAACGGAGAYPYVYFLQSVPPPN